MRKVHIIMYILTLILNMVFYNLLNLGGNNLWILIHLFFFILYLLFDIIFTTLSTDLLMNMHSLLKRIVLILLRDLFLICIWFIVLHCIGLDDIYIELMGCACYSIPKVFKIILADIIFKQKYINDINNI